MTSTKIKLTLSLTVVSMVLGVMVTLQYRQTQSSRLTGTLTATDTEEKQMESELTALKNSNVTAQQKLSQITAQLTTYEKKSAGASTQLQQLQAKLSQERILAGVTPVSGPGVTVTLMDGIATNGNIEQVLTHDWDVRSVINELFTAGAEAVSINNYRVVATSAIFCTGPVVRVNDHRLAPPFVIQAIGDPKTLQSALDIQGGVLDALRARSLRVSNPQQVPMITMPAFTGTIPTGSTTS
ncbi:DUF881 domain-containing protein [Alicyclobacillus tolerans]|uniref:DUF881 domain-containing protein n=1 Tax=Alicyclobacillus tolerans TaxID=90970 RepID=UPI001F367A55|nr:DUF881 domain-containing protein [Alicyclobacillus tolerans]MCF8564463.1 DUF881 domain-containing protein [Alicyclobacillus tolerans]